MTSLFHHRTKSEIETRRRIMLSIWAYAYEFDNNPLISDCRFDEEARRIDLSVQTARPDLDDWWRKEFHPDTGMWIHSHPELFGIQSLYRKHYGNRRSTL